MLPCSSTATEDLEYLIFEIAFLSCWGFGILNKIRHFGHLALLSMASPERVTTDEQFGHCATIFINYILLNRFPIGYLTLMAI